MNIAEINPYIRLAIHSELPAPFIIKRRVIFDYELLYIENGEMVLTYGEKKWHCQQGDMLLLCPGIPHSFHVSKVTLVQPHIHFDMKYDAQSEHVFICYKDYPELSPEEKAMIRENIFPNQDGVPFLKISDMPTFLRLFYEIIDTEASSAQKSVARKGKMLCLLSRILAENPAVSFSQSSAGAGVAYNVKSFIRANYHQNITLDALEQHFGYSKYYIEKLFKSAYGISVIGYRNKKRMEAALQLLPTHSVSETANILGYSSIYTFSNAFRKVYGLSPSKYYSQESATL